MPARQLGYTLIEILVVLSVLTLLAFFAFANYQKLKEDQLLKTSASDIAGLIHLAQSNSTSRYNCNSSTGASWMVVFKNSTSLDLSCQVAPSSAVVVKSITLGAHILVDTVDTIAGSCTLPVTVTYSPLLANVSFSDWGLPTCVGATVSSITVNLKNTSNNEVKSFKINKGGAIDVQ